MCLGDGRFDILWHPVATCGTVVGPECPATCGTLWRAVATDWMPANKPLLDAGWLSWGGPYDLSTRALNPLIFIDLEVFWGPGDLQPGDLGPECPATDGDGWQWMATDWMPSIKPLLDETIDFHLFRTVLGTCSLEAWGQNVRRRMATDGDGWQRMATDWMPSIKPFARCNH